MKNVNRGTSQDLASNAQPLYPQDMTATLTRRIKAPTGDRYTNAMRVPVTDVPVVECPMCEMKLVDSQPTIRCPNCGYVGERT